MIIAIDGPAGAGKSTASRALAGILGLTFLDTGAMYRAVTLACLERGVDPHDQAACAAVARELRLDFDEHGVIQINGRTGEPAIRGPEVTAAVSHVSAHPAVRRLIVPRQRDEARFRNGIVAEGRDVGSVVFPDADVKLYLDASPEVRARRRADEIGPSADYPRILELMRERDRLDRTRADSPLLCPPDAHVIDTDRLDPAGVVDAMLQRVRARIDARASGR